MGKEIDHHKDDQLRKQKEGKGHWKGELASNSESAVRVSLSFVLFRRWAGLAVGRVSGLADLVGLVGGSAGESG